MTDTRELNYIAMEEMIEHSFKPLELLKSLIRTMEAKDVNDNFAYICRMHEIEIPCGKELSTYEDRS